MGESEFSAIAEVCEDEPISIQLMKRENFAIEYVKSGFNLSAAASMAGVHPGTARGWLKEVEVMLYIDKLVEDRRKRLHLQTDAELVKLSNIIDLAVASGDMRAAVMGQIKLIEQINPKSAGQAVGGNTVNIVFGGQVQGNAELPARSSDMAELPQQQRPAIEVSGCVDGAE